MKQLKLCRSNYGRTYRFQSFIRIMISKYEIQVKPTLVKRQWNSSTGVIQELAFLQRLYSDIAVQPRQCDVNVAFFSRRKITPSCSVRVGAGETASLKFATRDSRRQRRIYAALSLRFCWWKRQHSLNASGIAVYEHVLASRLYFLK